MAKRGRPSLYTDELGKDICLHIMQNKTLREIGEMEGMPTVTTIMNWALDPEHDFFEQYTRARQVQAEIRVDEIFEIADDGRNDWMEKRVGDDTVEVLNNEHVQRSRIRIDTRKWYASKVRHKIYGDRIKHEGSVGHEHYTRAELEAQAKALNLPEDVIFGRRPTEH